MRSVISNQAAFVLHRRPFKESSFFLDVFSQDHGLISIIAKGARRPRSNFRGRLELFIPLSLSWQGNTNLPILTQVEQTSQAAKNVCLSGKALLCGFYLNELLIRLVKRGLSLPDLFQYYSDTLKLIAQTEQYEVPLRLFEKHFLKYLGYELPLVHLANTSVPVKAEEQYVFEAHQGARFPTEHEKEQGSLPLFSGESLLALAQNCLLEPKHLKEAKILMQLVFKTHFGVRNLKTRELFL